MSIIKITLPNSWNGLTNRQLERLALLFSTTQPSAKFDTKVLFILLEIKWWQYIEKAKIRIVLWNVPMSELRKNYDFIYNKNDRTTFLPFLKTKLSHRAESRCFFPPQDRIANLTCDEFAVADDLHIKWRETKNPEYLHYLTAVLYTKTKTRPDFDKNELHEKAKAFSKVPIEKLLAIEIAYFGCKNNIVKRFPKAFPKANPEVSGTKNKKYGFGKVILSMAKGDLSKLEAIKKVNIFAFLEQFEDDLIQAAKQK